jgi:deoxyribodipyrimidine photo-lyase
LNLDDKDPDPGVLVWFRRDLRIEDHAPLAAALGVRRPVHGVFLFDTEILDALENSADARVTFIWECVRELKAALRGRGGDLHVLRGRPDEEIPALARRLAVAAVYCGRDYEPAAIDRDARVAARLADLGIAFRQFKDQVVFELDEVRTKTGGAFSVFTPYRRAWLERLHARDLAEHATRGLPGRLTGSGVAPMPPLRDLGFERTALPLEPGLSGAEARWAAFRPRLRDYATNRDFPARDATSRLSVDLRFGTLSIRRLVREARRARGPGASAWLSELIWREFYFAILAWRPDVVDHAFHRRFDALPWSTDEATWRAWCDGRTGYPIVDAAMRELSQQGTMHNRLRMVTASFLTKDLGHDWRRGERHFAARLLDYDLAANNGGWQWCASTGCDAQPWFRIFNPVTQSRRFDPDGAYIRRWLPELERVPDRLIHAPWTLPVELQKSAGCVIGRDYPAPIVDHAQARTLALARYSKTDRGSFNMAASPSTPVSSP